MADMSGVPTVWVFNGARSHFPSGVFSRLETAEAWIRQHQLTGTLTRYPVDLGAYDWALGQKYFTPSKPEQTSPEFIGKFSAANQEHYHYENGAKE
jgi:hypothetical protein